MRFLKAVALVTPLLFAPNAARAAVTTVLSGSDWRAIGPVGNLEGQPLLSVGQAWEAANVGWNSSLTYNDSGASPGTTAQWVNAVVTTTGSIPGIWPDASLFSGATPAYFRKIVNIQGAVVSVQFEGADDDDLLMYINGKLALQDTNGTADSFPKTNVTSYFQTGDNLIAFKVQDTGGFQRLQASFTITNAVPEPSSFAFGFLAVSGLAAGLRSARRKATAIRFVKTAVLLAALFLASNSARAAIVTVDGGADWRAIAPVGNLEGQPILTVGNSWEAANVGWNSSLTYDDSGASPGTTATWHNAVVTTSSSPPGIWSDAGLFDGATPTYFRKVINVSGAILSVKFSGGVDDDLILYINGKTAISDTDGTSTGFNLDVTSFFQSGDNLIAIKAHDSFGGFQRVEARFTITNAVPEPSSFLFGALAISGLAAGLNRHAARGHHRRKDFISVIGGATAGFKALP